MTSASRGRTVPRRRGIQHFQDDLLARNTHAKLTDEQLLAAMREEFPDATGQIFTGHLGIRLARLRDMRRLFNRGQHDNQRIDPPPGGLKRWDANGNEIP